MKTPGALLMIVLLVGPSQGQMFLGTFDTDNENWR